MDESVYVVWKKRLKKRLRKTLCQKKKIFTYWSTWLDCGSSLSVNGWRLEMECFVTFSQQTEPLLLQIIDTFLLSPPIYLSLLLFISCLRHMPGSPLGKRCKQKAVSCWWEQCRRHSGTSGWVGYAESYQPETWSRQCCRQSTYRPPETGWQICPVTEEIQKEESQSCSDKKALRWNWGFQKHMQNLFLALICFFKRPLYVSSWTVLL